MMTGNPRASMNLPDPHPEKLGPAAFDGRPGPCEVSATSSSAQEASPVLAAGECERRQREILDDLFDSVQKAGLYD
jgi:hypothetical protein